jgi:NDP-sugar pyrophosphorylase family protein
MSPQAGTLDLADWPVAILAGGLATRLRSLTTSIPKALITVAGEPFAAHQLRLLHSRGIRQVVLCVGHLGEVIAAELGTGRKFGVKIDYSFDGPRLLGTGGALKRATDKLGDRFFVLYGDSYLPIDYGQVAKAFRESAKSALMTVYKNKDRWDRSNVWFDQNEIRRYEKNQRMAKMQHIDYGLGVFGSNVLAEWPDDEPFDLADVYRDLIAKKELAGLEVTERFYEIGSTDGLAELDSLLRKPATFLAT